jgi:hypothetical protein
MKSWYNPERYTLEMKYHTSDSSSLLDSGKMEEFIVNAKAGRVPLHTRSCPLP